MSSSKENWEKELEAVKQQVKERIFDKIESLDLDQMYDLEDFIFNKFEDFCQRKYY